MSEITLILERAEKGDPKAAEELLPLVYGELRRLAAHKMAAESSGHTLQPTALVHEAWLLRIPTAVGIRSLILPHADTPAMSLYLAEVSRRHPDEHILMFLDRAGWHRAQALVLPENLTLDWLPAYSPQGNPQELVWREMRRQPFGNHDYQSMDAVEGALERRLHQLESCPAQIQSLTGFDWIVNVRLNAK